MAALLDEIPAQEDSALIVVTHSERLAERFKQVFDLNEGRLTQRQGAG